MKYIPSLYWVKGRAYLRFYDPPRRKSISLRTRSTEEASFKAKRLIDDYIAGRYSPWNKEISCSEYVDQFLMLKKKATKEKTYRALVGELQHIPDVALDDLTHALLRDLAYRGNVSNQTIKHRITKLKGFLRFIEMDTNKRHPFMNEKAPKVHAKVPRYLSEDQFQDLMDLVNKKVLKRREYEWIRRAIQIGISTGARATTCLSLRKSDIQNGMIFIPKSATKTKGYLVPLFPLMQQVIKKADTDLLIGVPRRTDLLSHHFSLCRDELGWPKSYTFHVLRHTFASWLVMDNVPLYTVSKWLGHSSIKVTERYAHLAPDTNIDLGVQSQEKRTKRTKRIS